MTEAAPTIPPSDLHATGLQSIAAAGRPAIEVTHVHIFHRPDDAKDVNGFTFVLRDGEKTYTLSLREGASGEGLEPVPATAYPTGGEAYLSLVASRDEAMDELLTRLSDVGPLLAELMSDMKS